MISPLPPDADTKALVPKETAPDPQKLIKSDGFKEFLNKIADYATAQSNSPAMWERRRKAVTLRKYILGYFFGVFDKQKGFVASEGDGIYFDPQTPTAIDNLVASFIKTKPQKKCEARSSERTDRKEAARVAEKLLQMDDDQDFTPKKQQREWKWNLLAAGETYRITYFNQQKVGYGFAKEEFEESVIDAGEPVLHCALCDSVSKENTCQTCGNPQLDRYQVNQRMMSVFKGVGFQQVGDVDWDVPDALEMTVIGETDDIAEALIVRRERMIPRCVLEEALGEKNLPDTSMPDSLSYKRIFDDKQETSTMREFQNLHYEELWVAPSVIASYVFPKDTKTESGTISGETKGRDICPNGLYFSRVNKKVCEAFPQSIGETLSHAVNSIGEGFHGQGEWDLIELQDQATESKSMKMNSMLLDSTSPLMIRDGYTDANNFENKFGLVVPISQDFPLEQPLGNLMGRVPVGRMPAEAYQLGEEIKGQIQQRSGTFSTHSDAADIKAMGTATGIDAIAEQAVGRRGPALALYAQMEVEQAYQKLELRQKYWCKKMYEPVAKELGGDAVDWFMKCNIRQDINISVTPGSWMPRTETQKREGLKSFLQIAGNLLAAKGDAKLMDDILRQANDLFGAGIDIGDMQAQNVEAQLRLEKLRSVASYAEQQFQEFLYDEQGHPSDQAVQIVYQLTAEMLKIVNAESDENDVFAQLPLDVMFDTHSEFTESYTDWLNTAEGRAASQFERYLVRQLADYHVQAESYRQMKLKQYQNLTQLPDLQASLVQNAAMKSQEQDMAPPPEPSMPEEQKMAMQQDHEKDMKAMELIKQNQAVAA